MTCLSGQGVEPGLYVLVRAGTPAAMRSHLVQGASKSAEGGGGGEWVRPAGCPDDLPLFRVLSADTRQVAQALACNQEIAAEGAFAVAMVAELPAGEHDHLHTTVLAAPSHDAPAAFQCWSRKAGSAGAARTGRAAWLARFYTWPMLFGG